MSKVNEYALPDPGPKRFWHGIHNPKNATKPLILELREQMTESGIHLPKFSRLIGQMPTFADPAAVKDAAQELMVRASRVDEFVGILPHAGGRA